MSLLPNFSQARIVCIGDLMIDCFIRGNVEKLSPEAPTVILKPTEDRPMLGGVGNVARNLVALGSQVSLITVCGGDEAGQQAKSLLDHLAPTLSYTLLPDSSRQTTQKKRYISGTHHLLRVDREDTHHVSPKLEAMIFDHAKTALASADLLLLSDYKKGALTPALTQNLIQYAKAQDKIVVVDPKGRDYSHYTGADLLTPNAHELQEVTGLSTSTDDEMERATRALLSHIKISALLVTRGKKGMSIIQPPRPTIHIPTHAQDVFDVSGAGDTVIATLSASLASGLCLEESTVIANYAAGIAVSKMGTAVVSYRELHERLHRIVPAQKIMLLSQATEHVQQWRNDKKRIGFTNGCFDLLHSGHLHTFAEARKKCDHLIVGLNTDASVRALKGDSRPVQHEDLRAEVLASLSCVDLIVLFDSPTPLELIEALKPDLLVKGADYTIDQLSGASFVQNYGGEVFLVPLLEGHRTSHLVRQFLNSHSSNALFSKTPNQTATE